ncbi:hypothetical protein COV04_01375 [Candidatus Uhrbacteria bacterium CG10_big_fil_rev_8_21_14_0_10_48_11]|uniref:Uncharacterized protein n=1 Tax=Candidatus Uhrbacteria bacterium CG10_big_fil_rev_8_21_14_0_10_48_11 TaxID=1975037 RepID=A0A2M8LFE0_9BACT|nr:MAG: hypothetical protein COV04_01375 [Candidatus Uhrbacteria bacterium CG10_big_fil_rev_8_21_14_0_10_48_11]
MQFKKRIKQRPNIRWRYLLSAPFIYIVIFPIVLLDVAIEIYQQVCFPLYGIPVLRRKNYIRIDRHKLSYLNALEKLNCMYCGYASGVFYFSSAIAKETEKYWCGIMHNKYDGFKVPEHQRTFLPYNDEAAFKTFLKD